ncbi:putative coproporphyrinogen dehydrogenase [Leptospira yanagawae serovar Saopaulo str. Sao Paulo = ATCC 700523]|uniref:Heme chaperone HemW n=1 Tax=Leptospira yanagawae serovar Saopaulo str. Sao Paulo = ATCC 700523 TaxID=1249483 RepID=A0A5E8H923_9LEPT|nr:radical SAM family heme chaperone HemW [Leptospira yanagawae]EOQ87689.1 putative coproporphyrinogen dehydrogenase [Leptospira yanagawae serovar Saopaulo str. Sao Paulo = ATCC 700523]
MKESTEETVWQVRNSFFGVYVHFPYCFKKCDYCDFYSEGIGAGPANDELSLFKSYQKEVSERVSHFPNLKHRTIDTVFFGGGTPSKAKTKNWYHLLEFLRSEFNVARDLEISIEVNPEDLSPQLLEEYAKIGINRVNVGVQTRNPKGLAYLGRHYDKEKYDSLLQTLTHSPIQRVGIDLMYGIPGLQTSDFYSDLSYFLEAGLPHLSLYSLTLEKGTQYSRDVKDHKKTEPEENIQSEILTALPELMEKHGYRWYEVSNYAKPGFESKHNLKYWTYEPYLGIGPGAHGMIEGHRYGNPRNASLYQKKTPTNQYEPVTPNSELALTLFRLFSPFRYLEFIEMYLDKSSQAKYIETIHLWEKRGLCSISNGIFQWKKEALLLLDDLILSIIV